MKNCAHQVFLIVLVLNEFRTINRNMHDSQLEMHQPNICKYLGDYMRASRFSGIEYEPERDAMSIIKRRKSL